MSVDALQWFGEYGFLRVDSRGVYDANYFEKYIGYAATELGQKLNDFRRGLVSDWVRSEIEIVDIGIGCGQFVESRKHTLGYDVNPRGVEWLQERGLFFDPYRNKIRAMTFWDSFEHIECPENILEQCEEYAFMSIPIFKDREHVLRSKHFRPDEHYWYFTRAGLITYMRAQGFMLLEVCNTETLLGREDIESFVFVRR